MLSTNQLSMRRLPSLVLTAAIVCQYAFANATGRTAQGGHQRSPAEILGSARTIYIWSRTVLVKQEVIESALLKRDDFHQSGLLITKDAKAADLILTVRRANFTTEYPYDVVEQRTGLVVGGGKVNSLFGTAAGKIAKGFMKQLQQARPSAGFKAEN